MRQKMVHGRSGKFRSEGDNGNLSDKGCQIQGEEGRMSMTESEAIEVLKKPTEHIRPGDDDDCIFTSAHVKALETALEALEEVQQLHAIGTVSEFRELKEKATAKHRCPNCNELLNAEYIFCPTCRRKVDWSE